MWPVLENAVKWQKWVSVGALSSNELCTLGGHKIKYPFHFVGVSLCWNPLPTGALNKIRASLRSYMIFQCHDIHQ